MSLLSWSSLLPSEREWRPFLPIEHEMQSMLRRFEEVLGDSTHREPWRPTTDMFREDHALVLKVELPGVTAADVEVAIEKGMLHIHGEREDAHEEERDDAYLSERFFGRFDRQFVLPEGVDEDQVEAEFEHGVLTVRIPMPAQVEPTVKKIAIKGAAAE